MTETGDAVAHRSGEPVYYIDSGSCRLGRVDARQDDDGNNDRDAADCDNPPQSLKLHPIERACQGLAGPISVARQGAQ